jgi:hypothetical protein
MKIEYVCPTHGRVPPADPNAGVAICPMTMTRTVDGVVVVEPCSQPLTAYARSS